MKILVEGHTFTEDTYLRFEEDGTTPASDPVHLSEKGARKFAKDASAILKPHCEQSP